jgi:hypothetical protein
MNSANSSSSSSLIPLPTGRHRRMQGPRVWDGFLHVSASGVVMCPEVIGGADAGQSHVHLHVAFMLKLLCSCGHVSRHFSSVACSPYTHAQFQYPRVDRIGCACCSVLPDWLHRQGCDFAVILLFCDQLELLLVKKFMEMEWMPTAEINV